MTVTSSGARVLKSAAGEISKNLKEKMALYTWLFMIIRGACAALWQGAADSVPHVKAGLCEAYKVAFEKVNMTAANTLKHGWFEAGMTVMIVAPMWEYYILCRLGCAQFVWWWLFLYAVVFYATLPISRWYTVPVSIVMLKVLPCCGAPWQLYLLVFLANVKMSSRLLGARLDLLWLEARTLSEPEHMPKLMNLHVTIHDKNIKYFDGLRGNPVCTFITSVTTFAKMSRLFDEDLRRYPNTFAWTKLLCFRHVFIPLTIMRVGVIMCLEMLWLCACNLLPAAFAFLGFQPDLAGMFGAGVFGAGGRATQATDELLAALAADDAFMA